MTDQPRPPEARDDRSSGPGESRKEPVKRVVLGTGETMALAGYVQRLCARIIDTFVFCFGLGAFVLIIARTSEPLGVDDKYVLTTLLLPLINEVLAVTCCGRTLGMQALGIRLISKRTGTKPSLFASLVRWVLQPFVYLFAILVGGSNSSYTGDIYDQLPIYVLNIGWWLLVHFSVYLGEKRRGWHDLLAGTVVVTSDPPEPPDGGIGDDTLNGGPGDDALKGKSGSDALRGGPGDDALEGGDRNDILWGEDGGDRFWGGDHNDILWGGPGGDRLWGGKGRDLAYGGPGDDTLDGGPGADYLDGGPGADYLDGGDDNDACAKQEASTRCETPQTTSRQ